MGELYPKGNFKTGGKSLLSKRYNTPHRDRIIKTRVTEEEHADFMERLTAYGMSQSEFIRQAIFLRELPRKYLTDQPIFCDK